MAGLTSIFGGDDSNSTSGNDSDASGNIVGDLNSTLGLDINSAQSQQSVDDDGSSESSTNENSLGLDTSTDGLLGAVGDTFNSSDESHSS